MWPSALVAAVFAVHPLHVESVAWITERKDVLSGLFGLLALGAYAWYARGPSVVRYLSVAAALALGLMAKPMLVTWPFVFLLLDYWPLGRIGRGERGRKGEREKGREGEKGEFANLPFSLSPLLPFFPTRLLLEKVPLLLLVAASAAVTFLAQRSGGSVISLESVPISQRIARAAVLYVAYLGKTVWPVNLAVDVSRMADGELLAGVGGGGLAGAAHRRGLVGGVARAAVAGRGLVLVPGHPGADDRFGAGGFAGDGRPFPVPAADWPLRGPGLGRRGIQPALGLLVVGPSRPSRRWWWRA